jgi:hypothetical protein
LRHVVACAALACIACGVLSPEEQLLTDFFEASRLYDTSVMSRLSAVPLNPRTEGIVDAFDIERVDRVDDARKRVTVNARLRRFDGKVGSRQLVFSLVHRDGRWFIAGWK